MTCFVLLFFYHTVLYAYNLTPVSFLLLVRYGLNVVKRSI